MAFGAIGTPILTLATITDIPASMLSAMAGRQLPIVSLIIPAWLVVTMSGWRGLRGVWPAVLVSGGSFALVQFLWSNYVGPELVDIAGGLVSLGSLGLFCVWWKPAEAWDFPIAPRPLPSQRCQPGTARIGTRRRATARDGRRIDRQGVDAVGRASVFVAAWGTGTVKSFLNAGPAGRHRTRERQGAGAASRPLADIRRPRRCTRWCSVTSPW